MDTCTFRLQYINIYFNKLYPSYIPARLSNSVLDVKNFDGGISVLLKVDARY